MTAPLTLLRDGGECHVTLNRAASGNALSAELVGALLDVLETCRSDGTHRLILQGAGRHFCTGFDLSDRSEANGNDDCLLGRFVRIERLLQAVADAPYETVARVHGRAAGAGADLMVACTQRELTGDALVSFPGASGFGLVLGTRRLADRVGPAIAREWVSTGRPITAAEALSTGLATAVTTPHEAPRGAASRPGELDAITAALVDDALRGETRRIDDSDPARARRRANDKDLALLVASAARPGLTQRLAAYMESLSARRKDPPSTP